MSITKERERATEEEVTREKSQKREYREIIVLCTEYIHTIPGITTYHLYSTPHQYFTTLPPLHINTYFFHSKLFMVCTFRFRIIYRFRMIGMGIRTFLSQRTKSSNIHLTYPPSLDMSLRTVRSQRTKSPLVPRTQTNLRIRIDMSIQTFLDILTISMFIIKETCAISHLSMTTSYVTRGFEGGTRTVRGT